MGYKIEDLHVFAKSKNGRCLSTTYVNNETSYTWECENKHVFEKLWISVKTRGAWCNSCRYGNGLSQMQEYAKKYNGKCLATKYTRCDVKYDFECEYGHVFSACWSNIKRKCPEWCTICSKKITLQTLCDKAKEYNGKCLSTVYTRCDDKYTWECVNGHIWDATWINVGYKNATWCGQCLQYDFESIQNKTKELHPDGACLKCVKGSGMNGFYQFQCAKKHVWITKASNVINTNKTWCAQCQKLSLQIAHKEACKRNGECLSTTYINKRLKLIWKCEKGHIFESRMGSVRNGQWCKKCVVDNRRLSIEDAHELAKQNGGVCHTNEYINTRGQLTWECKEGHIWDAPFASIKSGCWCLQCAMNKRRVKCLHRIVKWINSLGGHVITDISTLPINSETKDLYMTIKCNKKHIFTRTIQTLKTGSWCPKCRFKSEEMCREIFEDIFKAPFVKRRLEKMEYLELDGYCKEFSLAFEYDGKQHIEYTPFFHRNGYGDLEKQMERDIKKENLCIKNGIHLIRIPHIYDFSKKEETTNYIVKQLEENCM